LQGNHAFEFLLENFNAITLILGQLLNSTIKSEKEGKL